MKKLLLVLLVSAFAFGASAQKRNKDMELANKVAKWQMDNYSAPLKKPRGDMHWANGTLFRGLFKWGEFAGNQSCFDFLIALGEKNNWTLLDRVYHADDICAGWTYLKLYEKYKREEMLTATKERADYIIANPSKIKISYIVKDGRSRWTWCDALYMAPPVYTELTRLTNDKKYLTFMDEEFYATYRHLYDFDYDLWYRDCNFVTRLEANGKPVFWGRGNGWVYAALPMILESCPKDWPTYDFYLRLYKKMSAAIIKCQDSAGSWHASMLDTKSYPVPENSASGFFVYGLAWGVNNGILTDAVYKKAAKKGWKALKSHVNKDGKLGYVQPIGASPKKVKAENSEMYGVGAFLCAAIEMIKMK